MWGWVWTLLALAAIAFLAWIAWRVVRSGIALMRQAGRAAQTFGEASDRLSDVVAQAERDRVAVTATMFDDRAELRDRVRVLRHERWERRGRRRGAQAALWQQWARTTWLERRQAARRAARRNGA